MVAQFRGLVLFAFGAFVVVDAFLGMVMNSPGTIRVLYFVLGAYLIVRGALLLKPRAKKHASTKLAEESED